MKSYLKSGSLAAAILFTSWSGAAAAPDWTNAEWIGFTEDHRPAENAQRAVVFSQTPANPSKAAKPALEPKPVMKRTFPAPLLRKSFSLEKPVKAATVAICGIGLHELYLNGKKVGDAVLAPAQTTYGKRAFYLIHDVAGLLRPGGNAIGVMLGNGFYGQNIAFGGLLAYGEPRVSLALSISYMDGTVERIVTNPGWRAEQGPVQFDNIYAGETYDARREVAGWSTAGFDDSAWWPVKKMAAPTTKLVEQEMPPMRKIRSLKPVAALPAENGEWIIDMGQKMTGWLTIRVREAAGKPIKMCFAELLMPGGKAINTASTGGHVTGSSGFSSGLASCPIFSG